jgi:endonuclease/exonuclease/phosphatase family protein
MDNIKILQLNVWGGRIKDGLTNFIKEGNYDLICLQEAVWDRNHTKTLEYFMDTVDKIKEEANFKYDTRSSQFGISILNNIIHYESGNAILSKIPFKHSEEKILHGEYRFATNLDQYEHAVKHNLYTAQKVILENGLTVINYHGYWLKDPLGDETSVLCMRSVADMISSDKNPVVLCGDLNVIPEAKAMRELDFLRDLTAIHNIPTTLRNIRFTKDVPCDHILISDNINYQDFEVIDAPISDHCALTVKINF